MWEPFWPVSGRMSESSPQGAIHSRERATNVGRFGSRAGYELGELSPRPATQYLSVIRFYGPDEPLVDTAKPRYSSPSILLVVGKPRPFDYAYLAPTVGADG